MIDVLVYSTLLACLALNMVCAALVPSYMRQLTGRVITQRRRYVYLLLGQTDFALLAAWILLAGSVRDVAATVAASGSACVVIGLGLLLIAASPLMTLIVFGIIYLRPVPLAYWCGRYGAWRTTDSRRRHRWALAPGPR